MMTIGRLATETGVRVETIRYYERVGLLTAPARSDSGYRLYDRDGVRRLKFIRQARMLGFSLAEVGTFFRMMAGDAGCEEVKSLTEQHLLAIRTRIAELQRLEATLAEISSACAGGALSECPIIERLFAGDGEG